MADDDKTQVPPRRAPLPGVSKAPPAAKSPVVLLRKLHAKCGSHSTGALRMKIAEVIALLEAG